MLLVLRHAVNYSLKKQTGKEPDRCIIKADESFDVEFGPTVIPRTGVVLFEEGAGKKFSDKYQDGVECASKNKRNVLCMMEQRCKKHCSTIDRKHPIRCFTEELFFFFAERVQTGPKTFQTPTAKSADTEVFDKLFHADFPLIIRVWI